MNEKQIKKSQEQLTRMIRLYIVGYQKPSMVKNALNCLFVDILLDERLNKDTQNKNFNQLLEEMIP